MSILYSISGISKQAYHQYLARQAAKEDRSSLYLQMVIQARLMHPVIGLEKIYHLYKPEGIGRDAFIHIATLAGYALEKPPMVSWKGSRVIPYQNLLSGKYFTAVNQIWVTDITYFKLGDSYYYISMIMDLYSRRIIACGLADSLHASHSLALLRKALKDRPLPRDHQLIHHSDKGVQYTSLAYTALLKKHGIGISMCNSVFENTAMERLNGIIKNDYLIHWYPKSYQQLKSLLKKAVRNYNLCPHGELKMNSPEEFEDRIKQIPLEKRKKMKVFTLKNKKGTDPNQLVLFDQKYLDFLT